MSVLSLVLDLAPRSVWRLNGADMLEKCSSADFKQANLCVSLKSHNKQINLTRNAAIIDATKLQGYKEMMCK